MQKLNISKELISNISSVVITSMKANKVIEERDSKGKSLINNILDEVILLKKEVEVPEKVEDINAYKLRVIKHNLKELNANKYYLQILEVAFKYLTSGYSLNINKTPLNTIKQVLDLKPTKASIKKASNTKELTEILNKLKLSNKSKETKELKESLSKDVLEYINTLKPDDIVSLKRYLNSMVSA